MAATTTAAAAMSFAFPAASLFSGLTISTNTSIDELNISEDMTKVIAENNQSQSYFGTLNIRPITTAIIPAIA